MAKKGIHGVGHRGIKGALSPSQRAANKAFPGGPGTKALPSIHGNAHRSTHHAKKKK